MKHSWKINAMAFAVASVLAVAGSAAFAAKPPGAGGGGGGGGGGGPPTSEAAQNLSVPAILVGSLGTLVCGSSDAPSPLVSPSGTPLTGYEVPGYYWVQKVHTWQAECFNDTGASVYGNWGDNLTGDAKLSTGSPIRVELVLTNMTDFGGAPMAGFTVIKLQTSLADRLSAYGHEATGDAVDGWGSTPVSFPQASWVVHDAGMQLSVQNLDTGQFVVPLGPIAPEINATGKIVYGYNLRVTAAGNYRIRFNSTPLVTFTGCDAGVCVADGNDAILDIIVKAKAGGGGGGGKPVRP
jgi:hypothetical protein